MPDRDDDYLNRKASAVWLWAGISAGPVAVALNQRFAYLLAPLKCSYGKVVSLWPVRKWRRRFARSSLASRGLAPGLRSL